MYSFVFGYRWRDVCIVSSWAQKEKMRRRMIQIQNLILVITLLMVSFSCNQRGDENTIELTCDSVKEMMNRDQNLRKKYLRSQYFSNLDSLIKLAGYNEGLDAMPQLDDNLSDSLRARAKELEKPFTEIQKRQRDSIWEIQSKIDSLNTLKLISIIDKFGIDSLNKVDRACGENSLIVFVHSPEGLKPIVREVINKNKEEVGENRFRHIMWHLDGRTKD